MSNPKNVTNISVFFKGTKGKERKVKNQSFHITYLDGHVMPDLETFKNEAIQRAEKDFKVFDYTLRISANFGKMEDDMVMVELFPKKSLVFKYEETEVENE